MVLEDIHVAKDNDNESGDVNPLETLLKAELSECQTDMEHDVPPILEPTVCPLKTNDEPSKDKISDPVVARTLSKFLADIIFDEDGLKNDEVTQLRVTDKVIKLVLDPTSPILQDIEDSDDHLLWVLAE
jgi:hypothetical protein